MDKTANNPLMRDENRIARFTKDLEVFSKQLNALIGRLQDSNEVNPRCWTD